MPNESNPITIPSITDLDEDRRFQRYMARMAARLERIINNPARHLGRPSCARNLNESLAAVDNADVAVDDLQFPMN